MQRHAGGVNRYAIGGHYVPLRLVYRISWRDNYADFGTLTVGIGSISK